MPKRIYIAGKITDCTEQELKKFDNYAATLSSELCFHGLMINAAILGKAKWSDYMRNDIRILMTCDEIHMLSCWEDSKGAKIEHQLAIDLGLTVVYAPIPFK